MHNNKFQYIKWKTKKKIAYSRVKGLLGYPKFNPNMHMYFYQIKFHKRQNQF